MVDEGYSRLDPGALEASLVARLVRARGGVVVEQAQKFGALHQRVALTGQQLALLGGEIGPGEPGADRRHLLLEPRADRARFGLVRDHLLHSVARVPPKQGQHRIVQENRATESPQRRVRATPPPSE